MSRPAWAGMDLETASAAPRSPVSCTITARHLTWVQDKPADLGGTDEGPMASELLLSALLSCQLSTFAKVRAKRGTDLEVERLDGELGFDDSGDIAQVRLHWHLQGGADDAAVETLLRLTDKVCTISRVMVVKPEWAYSRS